VGNEDYKRKPKEYLNIKVITISYFYHYKIYTIITDLKILCKVISIASKHSGIKESKLNANSSVNFDLQIDGDDIEDMIADIDREFNLNFDGFDYSKYFNSESETGLISSLIYKIFKNKGSRKIIYDFKLGDFVRWILNEKWEEAKIALAKGVPLETQTQSQGFIYFYLLTCLNVFEFYCV